MIYNTIICQQTGAAADDLKCFRCVHESDRRKTCPLYARTIAFMRRNIDKDDVRTVPYEDMAAYEAERRKAKAREERKKMLWGGIAVIGLLLMFVGMSIAKQSQAGGGLALIIGMIAFPVGFYNWNRPLAEAIGAIGLAWSASGTITKAINNLADMDKEK